MGIIALPVLAWGGFAIAVQPSNDRDWAEDQAVHPRISVEGDVVRISDMRNFSYTATDIYESGYMEGEYDINDLRGVWYIVEPFPGNPGAAHTFLSFEFADDRFLPVSVEIRKEKGESFSALKGMLRRYELMYVIGDERDLVKLRSNYRKDEVFVYPLLISNDSAKELFLSMMARAQQLQEYPEFYNTLSNTCMTNIVSHLNTILPGTVPMSYKTVLPAYSDELFYDLKLIPHDAPLEEIRQRYRINERAMQYADDPMFPRLIRTEDPFAVIED